ncbi:hypothetical protein [Lederbergia graminis]|uniref:Uncharacterized protein n=1 Tax=Lederbergia graminis TaxID=735518 RepID=A0ABW0LKN7_9BACI|nr:hypothetical protein [Paenibacillus bovis]HLU23419.1 hypothetical protein [Bacillaceae bacterium]
MQNLDETKLFMREIYRLLDDFQRSPLNMRVDIMKDIQVLLNAVKKITYEK